MIWAEQQFTKRREKRNFIPIFEGDDVRLTKETILNFLKKNEFKKNLTGQIIAQSKVPDSESPEGNRFNDELWEQQWYLVGNNFTVVKLILHWKSVSMMCFLSKTRGNKRIYRNWTFMYFPFTTWA